MHGRAQTGRIWPGVLPAVGGLLVAAVLSVLAAAPAAARPLAQAGTEQTEWTTDDLTYVLEADAPFEPNTITITRTPGTDEFQMSATVTRLTQHDFFEIGPCEGVYTNTFEGEGTFDEVRPWLIFTGTIVTLSEYRCDAEPVENVRENFQERAEITDVGLEGVFEGYEFSMPGVPVPVGTASDGGAGPGAWVLVLVALVIGGVVVAVYVLRPAKPPVGDTVSPGEAEQEDESDERSILLELTYPAGASPNVFTKGWIFGARCLVDPGSTRQADRSSSVRWGGTGAFSPPVGATSRPVFDAEGANTIELSVDVDGVTHTRTFAVTAIDPQRHGFVGVGGIVKCRSDAHGCPACPHEVTGWIDHGSPTVTVADVPAARLGDTGTHAACCGPNSFEITSGDSSVLIDGRPAAKRGCTTQHCGGSGVIE